MLYPAQQDAAIAAGPHLQVLGIACIFICLMTLTNAILQSYGHERIPICTMIAGGVVKIVMNYVLVGNPDINIHGAPISTLCCSLVISGLNLFFVWKYSPEKPHYLQLFTKPVVASVLMGGAAWAVYGLASRVLGNNMSVLLAICVAMAIYAALIVLLQVITRDDLSLMPKGRAIGRLLHIK